MFTPVSHSLPKHRLFFAITPPELVARRMAHWAEHRFGPHGAYVRAGRLHVTLDILDDFDAFPRDTIEKLIAVADMVAADPFIIELDQVSGGGGSATPQESGIESVGHLHCRCAPKCRNPGARRRISLQPARYAALPKFRAVYRDGDALCVGGAGVRAHPQPARPDPAHSLGDVAAQGP